MKKCLILVFTGFFTIASTSEIMQINITTTITVDAQEYQNLMEEAGEVAKYLEGKYLQIPGIKDIRTDIINDTILRKMYLDENETCES